uniref:Uncharacterized protein n=1 Tax=Arundo donax TaxID=35708 RepID=A0A0A9EF38_ARUDO
MQCCKKKKHVILISFLWAIVSGGMPYDMRTTCKLGPMCQDSGAVSVIAQ